MCVSTNEGWEIVSGGSTARVEKQLNNDEEVVKLQYPNCHDPDLTGRELQREYDIYRKLPRHPRLLSLLHDSSPSRLVLPYLPGGTLEARLKTNTEPLSRQQRLQLAADAAEAVAVLHANAVIHGDIQLRNFMLDEEGRLIIIDFAGSTLDGQQGTALEGTRYFLPRQPEDPSTVRTDIFALGTVLYAILAGQELHEGQSEKAIAELLGNQDFPYTDDVPCGCTISDCWSGRCASAEQAYQAISRNLKHCSESA
ncbi:Putative protein kinase [Septoria linicola]|uniref:Protein kinase domain-containing protein n=1 Tax=Septoria linicola TaxID=215465 RepID=A0A9Q9B006_9PEZI|nr:putative protein kinase [Septoria linicola]USW58489.1 Putative protein kinase [Septoria linicola]